MSRATFAPGIHQITNEQYHSAEGVSRSSLWTFKQLPQKYWFEHLSGQFVRPNGTEAHLIGEMLHIMLLEPHLFDAKYYVIPKVNRTTKAGKASYQEGLDIANGRIIINSEQYFLASGMAAALNEREVVQQITRDNPKVEQSIFWVDEETGIMCKARPDIWKSPLVADLKTTIDAGYRGFQMSAMKYGYFLQAAMIYEALKSIGEPYEKFLFMCVEKNLPHAVGLYVLDEDALQFGLDLFHSLLRKFAECQFKDEWPDHGIQMLMIPKYATMELNNE